MIFFSIKFPVWELNSYPIKNVEEGKEHFPLTLYNCLKKNEIDTTPNLRYLMVVGSKC